MPESPDPDARLPALEERVDGVEENVAAARRDAAAARRLAAAADRDVADLGVKVDTNRNAINALAVQAAEGFAEMRRGFADIHGRLDRTAVGRQVIVDLLTRLLPDESNGR